MEIGNWKATAELNDIYRRARSLGIETNLAELESFGFTIIEPSKAAPNGFSERLLSAMLSIAETEDPMAVDLSTRAQKDKPNYGRNLFHLNAKNPVFAEAIMNPVAHTLAQYMMGASCRLSGTTAFIKEGAAGCTPMHSDSVGVPPPLPYFGNICNISWILTDYREETGTFFVVPGSHRFCRHPTAIEQPKFMGGNNDNEIGIPIIAEPGSLFVFHGNTWHGTYPKKDAGLRAHVVTAFCRNYVEPGERFEDIPAEMITPYGAEYARLIGRDAWQGYTSGGPKYDRVMRVLRAHQTPTA